ncbi:MAG: site-2 protease family protein [Thermoguttaceae bacterium]
MILAEPSPSQGDLHFSLLGFPVRINPWFWLTTLFLGDLHAEPIVVMMWVAAVLLCILLHELGHAVVMQVYGYRPSIVLYGFGGLTIPHPGPSSARRPGPGGQMLISIAGPASGFILSAVLVLGLHYLGGYRLVIFDSSWRDFVPLVIFPNSIFLTRFIYDIFYITVMWGLLNLLPIYPLDGGQIAQQIFVMTNPQNRQDAMRQSLILSVIVGGMLAAMAFLQWQQFYLGLFLVWLTYSNFMTLQSYNSGWH